MLYHYRTAIERFLFSRTISWEISKYRKYINKYMFIVLIDYSFVNLWIANSIYIYISWKFVSLWKRITKHRIDHDAQLTTVFGIDLARCPCRGWWSNVHVHVYTKFRWFFLDFTTTQCDFFFFFISETSVIYIRI